MADDDGVELRARLGARELASEMCSEGTDEVCFRGEGHELDEFGVTARRGGIAATRHVARCPVESVPP